MYHFIGIYNIASVIHHNTQQSVMDRVKIIIQRHKNNYFKNWSTQELTFPQYILQYLLQYYTQVNNFFFKSQYWYNTGTNFYTSIVIAKYRRSIHPYNPKYSRLQNKNRFHVNANGHLRMHCLLHQLRWPLIYTWILYYHIGHKTWTKY